MKKEKPTGFSVITVPVAKPRMPNKKKFGKEANKYWAYKDELIHAAGLEGYEPSPRLHMLFEMPMPPSWSKRKKFEMHGMPHQQVPDIDNLVKGVMDALFDNDSEVHEIAAAKIWSERGKVYVYDLEATWERTLDFIPGGEG